VAIRQGYLSTITRSPVVAEKADNTALSGIADRGYARRSNFKFGNFGGREFECSESV